MTDAEKSAKKKQDFPNRMTIQKKNARVAENTSSIRTQSIVRIAGEN